MPDGAGEICELRVSAFDTAFDEHFEVTSHAISAALHGHPGLDEEEAARCAPLLGLKAEPRAWGLRVRVASLLWDYVAEDLRGYASSHGVDEKLHDVCLTSPCRWHHHAPANTVAWAEATGTVEPMKASMKLVVERYVKPWTAGYEDAGLALVLNAGYLVARRYRTAAQMCMADVFISHCWNEGFADFVRALKRALDVDTVVWICSFAVWQHGDASKHRETLDKSPSARALRASQRVLIIADTSLEVLDRSWCVFEAMLALEWAKPYDFCVPNELDKHVWLAVDRKIAGLDVKACKATLEADKAAIIRYAAQRSGGVDAANEAVRNVTRRAMARAQVQARASAGDLDALLAMGTGELLRWRSVRGRSIAHVLAKHSRVFALLGVLEASGWAQLNLPDKMGQTPLSVAAGAAAVGSVEALLALRADVDAPDRRGLTPLHHAASENLSTIATLLVQAKASLEAQGTYRGASGISPLAVACREGHADVVQALMQQRANALAQVRGQGLLQTAASYASPQTSAVLLVARAEVDGRSSRGETPLMLAVEAGCVATASLLLAAGASTLSVDRRGRSCRDFCREGRGGEEASRHIMALLDGFDGTAAKADDGPRPRDDCCAIQ